MENQKALDESALPLSGKERIIFNSSIFFLVICSIFYLVLFGISRIGLDTMIFGAVWAIPGIVILAGFFHSRAVKKLSRLRVFIFCAEAIFIFYMFLLSISVQALPGSSANHLGTLIFNLILVLMYLVAVEIGFFRIIKKHENAYYNENLKGVILKVERKNGQDNSSNL